MAYLPSSSMRPPPKSKSYTRQYIKGMRDTQQGVPRWGVGGAHNTLVPALGILQRVDELRVKAGCHFNAHAAEEEPDVHVAEIRFLVPDDLVLGDEVGDDGVTRRADVHLGLVGDADHFGLFVVRKLLGKKTACTEAVCRSLDQPS